LLVDKNEHLDNKKFICINETSSTKDSYNGDSDKLKTLITEEVMTIRGMYKAPRVTKSYAEYMITTNHAMSVKIESNDRRYLQLEVSSAKMNDKAYWADLYENHLTQDIADVFYSWLMDMNVGMEFKQIPLPMTDLKRSIISVKMCSVESYVHYLLETYSDTLDGNYESNEFIKSDDHRMVAKCSVHKKFMTKTEVYRSYEIYCNVGNERVAKSKELHRQLGDLTNIIPHKSNGIRGYKLIDFKLT
jgi:phage/plasmid-associated DNA primase